MSDSFPYWQIVRRSFDQDADAYDRWFAGNTIFATELAALKAIDIDLGLPGIEVGVGPGHFAKARNISFGIDPAINVLKMAKGRNIRVCNAIGEQLPFLDGVFNTVYLLFTDCFLENPINVLGEAWRVLGERGNLVIGMIPAESPWGRSLAGKGDRGHAMYRHARFNSFTSIQDMLGQKGFKTIQIISSLLQSPDDQAVLERPVKEYVETAGFVVLVAENTLSTGEIRVSCRLLLETVARSAVLSNSSLQYLPSAMSFQMWMRFTKNNPPV